MKHNPYELIYLSRMGYSHATQALIHDNQTYYIYLKDTVTRRSSTSLDDLMLQEMYIGTMEAFSRFREDQTASWRTFMTLVLKRKMVNVLRKADVRDWTEHTMSMDAMVMEDETVYDCFHQTDSFADPVYCMNYHEAQVKLKQVIQSMNREEQAYVSLWTKNISYQEGCEAMNCSKKIWYRRMEKVRAKVRNVLLEEC